MHQDGPRRQGRFIKKGSRVLTKINLHEFSFTDINETHSVGLDNAEGTIIHAKYHDRQDIDAAVHAPEKFDENLENPNQTRPLIMPVDFTKDWERDKKLRKARASRQDDDDFDFDYQESLQKLHESEAPPPPHTPSTQENTSADDATPPSQEISTEMPEPPTYTSMNVVGKAIKDLAGESASDNGFVPVPHNALASNGSNPEEAALDAYKQRLEQQAADLKASEERLQNLYEDAKARGYQDGFRVGEEKGELKAREQGAAIFGKVAELIQELGSLKHGILENVQENFYELCQAMAEALIKREFSINPETFVTVMKRAISEAVEPGKIRIRIHPEMFDKIQALKIQELDGLLVKDAETEKGDFRVESDMSVVDVSITKLLSEMLAQADLNIFDGDSLDEVKKAG